MVGFFVILGSIILGNALWWLWADRRLRGLPGAVLWRSLLAVFIGGQFAYLAAFFLVPSWARQSHHVLPAGVLGLFYLWSIIVLPATALLTLVLSGGLSITRRFRRGSVAPAGSAAVTPALPTSAEGPTLSRRQWLGAAGVALPPLVTGAGVLYGRRALYDLEVRRLDVRVPDLPPHLNGLTIAHLTDIHVGKFVTRDYLRKVSDLTNTLRADLHLLTGDLIDLSIKDLPDALDFVESLEPVLARPIMCEGNHDLIESPEEFYRLTKARGVDVLRDTQLTLNLAGRPPVQVLGQRWSGNHVASPDDFGFTAAVDQLSARRDPAAFPVLLAHHPHSFDVAVSAGIPLTLAGHTHGGLLMLSERVGPAAWMYRYFRGLYTQHRSNLYVSNGVGSWFPVRTNARPEVALLTLRPA